MPEEDSARRGPVALRWRSVDGSLSESALARVAVEDLLHGVPVREFRWYRGRRYYSGWYWSATTRRPVGYESRLELARIMLADFDPEVVGIAAQPFQLVGEDGGRVRRHVPDLLLVNGSGLVTIVDVKPVHRVADPDVAAVFTWTQGPTEDGHALLALLQQPRVAQLLDQYAKPLRRWRPDDPRRSMRYAKRSRPRPGDEVVA